LVGFTFTQTVGLERSASGMDRLMDGERGTVLLIVDGHPTHKSQKVHKHLDKFNGRLKIYMLPGYSPELNPDKLVWNWMKSHKLGKESTISSKQELIDAARKALNSLQRRISTIRSFFEHPELAYIRGKDFCTC